MYHFSAIFASCVQGWVGKLKCEPSWKVYLLQPPDTNAVFYCLDNFYRKELCCTGENKVPVSEYIQAVPFAMNQC